jgi:hypothetical protein
MISGVKRFGSYVRTEYEEEPEPAGTSSGDDSIVTTSCAIPSAFTDLSLLSKRRYNHDTSVFEFKLPHGRDSLGAELYLTLALLTTLYPVVYVL